MTTVTALTAERMEAIEAASIVGGEIIEDHLILTRYDSTTIDAGEISVTGGGGSSDTDVVVITQSTPSASWVLTHAYPGGYPHVTIVTSAGDQVEANIHYDSPTQITVTMSGAMSGSAYLS